VRKGLLLLTTGVMSVLLACLSTSPTQARYVMPVDGYATYQP